MRAHFGLPSVEKEDQEGRPPIHIKFEIPYFTVSGIQVSHLKWGLGQGVRERGVGRETTHTHQI